MEVNLVKIAAMGICLCKTKTHIISRDILQKAVTAAIDNNDIAGLEDLYEFFMKKGSTPYGLPVLGMDETIVNIQGVELNALAYAFRHGREEVAKFLIEKAGCSVNKLMGAFRMLGKTPLHILCEYGHIELLTYYLPIYFRSSNPQVPTIPSYYDSSCEEMSIFADRSHRRTLSQDLVIGQSLITQTPAHKACERGQIEVLRVLADFSATHGFYKEIDVHTEDDKSGENCALISCRTGNISLMRFLHEDCRANFNIKNRRKEGALQLALLGAKKRNPVRFFECVRYLIEKVRIDVMFEYEETLLLVEDPFIEEYLHQKLLQQGVTVTKQKVEETYCIVKRSNAPEVTPLDAIGTNFQLSEVFRSEFANKSYISSIPPLSDHSHDFTSVALD